MADSFAPSHKVKALSSGAAWLMNSAGRSAASVTDPGARAACGGEPFIGFARLLSLV
jgi:hypothetical protein